MTDPAADTAQPSPARSTTSPETATFGSLALAVLTYTVARLALVVVVAAVIWGIGALLDVEVPLVVAALFGLLIAMPLGLIAFKSLRLRVNSRIAAYESERHTRQDDLRARMRGEK